jgi:hypothetical protein
MIFNSLAICILNLPFLPEIDRQRKEVFYIKGAFQMHFHVIIALNRTISVFFEKRCSLAERTAMLFYCLNAGFLCIIKEIHQY